MALARKPLLETLHITVQPDSDFSGIISAWTRAGKSPDNITLATL